jgi:hypothetical protein
MKYKLLLAIVLMGGAAIVIDSSEKAYGNAGGAPAGTTGSPADGTTCANQGCHTGSAVIPITGWITSNIPGSGYVPGHVYSITAKAVYIGRSKFGFEVSPQNAAGNVLGTMTPVGIKTHLNGAGYITQTGNANIGTDSLSWTFNWTAPASGSGNLTFYGAFNCANGNSAVSGDLIYTSTLAVIEAPSPGVDAGILAVSSPYVYTCSNSITPVVTLRNFGVTTLTSATINYHTDANTPSTFAWTGNLATDSSKSVTLPTLTVTSGTHTFSVYTTMPNSVADTIPANDGKVISFDAKLTPATLPFSEGFDTTFFPKSGWEINNPDHDTTWRRVTNAFHSGTASVFIDNYLYKKPGAKDELITPTYNLSSITTPVLTFQVAYELYTNPSSSPNASDTLVIYVSTDCGTTWNQLYKKYGVGLTTTSPAFATSSFVPIASQWRFESINLAAYATASNAMFKFVNITDYENNLYLDEIRINNTLGINGQEKGVLSLTLFPNPASDQLTVNYELTLSSPVSFTLYDLQGRAMTTASEGEKSAGKHISNFDLKNYPEGNYLLHISAGELSATRRFTVSH